MNNGPSQGEKTTGGFLRAVLVLVGGTALAHGITAGAMPIVSRIYTPADMSVLAVFSGLLAIVSVAACLRFDIAVSLPEADADASNLLAVAVLCAAVVSVSIAILVFAAPNWVAARLGQPRIEPYLWMLPLGAFLAAVSNALQGWYVRARNFGRLAGARVAQSAAGATLQVGLGLLTVAPLGLLVAALMSTASACAALCWPSQGPPRGFGLPSVSRKQMTRVVRAYDRFPKYSTWEALCNSAAGQIPIIMIAALAAPSEAGHLVLAVYVMQAPMALVGTAIAQVYLSRGPEEFRKNRLGIFTAEVFGGLFKAGAGPLLAIGVVSPFAFRYVFGSEWDRAGQLVAWMTPWFILQFLASPISMSLHITGRQRTAMALQMLSLAIRVLAVWLASRSVPSMIGEAFAVSGLIVYAVYVAFVLVVVKAPAERLGSAIMRSVPITLAWAAGGAGLALLLRHLSAQT